MSTFVRSGDGVRWAVALPPDLMFLAPGLDEGAFSRSYQEQYLPGLRPFKTTRDARIHPLARRAYAAAGCSPERMFPRTPVRLGVQGRLSSPRRKALDDSQGVRYYSR